MITAVKAESAASDSALAGAPAARRVYREIASAPAAARRTVVVGPGGCGKTVLLDVLGALYRAAGLGVRHDVPEAGEPTDPNVVLLVDDAHELDEAALGRVGAWAADPGSQIVLAHRPWPRRRELAAIVVAFGASRGPLLLGPLDRQGVAARANLLLGERPTAELVDLVFEQTEGSPDLVDRPPVARRRAASPTGSASCRHGPRATRADRAAARPSAAGLHRGRPSIRMCSARSTCCLPRRVSCSNRPPPPV